MSNDEVAARSGHFLYLTIQDVPGPRTASEGHYTCTRVECEALLGPRIALKFLTFEEKVVGGNGAAG
jgi:hypothetical protein